MQWKERLNVEIYQTGEKQRLIFVKIGKWLRFACVWACFVAGIRVYGDLHVTESEKERLSVEISETGEKQRLIFIKIGKWLRFACVWACFDAEKRVLQVCRWEASV